MLGKSILLSALAAIATVEAQLGENHLGFNYGAAKANGQLKVYKDYHEEFELAQNLAGQKGKFNSARLYTNIQGHEGNKPIDAIKAAIDTKTTLLLGLWCSAGPDVVKREIESIQNAIKQFGSAFTDLVVGISIGSEDLYRNSPMGIENESGLGAHPHELVKYIKDLKASIKGTELEGKPLGHVDTWTVWVNGSNSEVAAELDWIGFDAYPYFQSTMDNPIEASAQLFWDAFDATEKATGKPVWITETGWPIQGKDMNMAKAGVEPAQEYWNMVGCAIFEKYPTWWYMLRDADPAPPPTEFGIVGSDLKPYYDLSCKNAKPSPRPTAAPTTSAPSATRTSGTSFTVDNAATETPDADATETSDGAPQTTDDPSSATGLKVAFGLVALQAVVAAFFML